jgi:hypothetical protein
MRDMLDDDGVEHEPPPKRWLYWAGGGVAVAGLAAFFLLPHAQTKRAQFDNITTVTLPPPPPLPKPPPPQPQKAPEPDNQQKTVTTSTPHNSASHGPSHGALTAMAGAGSNPYGLQAGNGDGDGTIGGDGGEDWSSYSPGISSAMQSVISSDADLSSGKWEARVRIWFNPSGVITRVELAESSGDPKRDQKIQSDYVGVRVISNPPSDMPQPITISINATPT